MQSLTVQPYQNPETGDTYNALYVDGELFDWDTDKEALQKAKQFSAHYTFLAESIAGDIQKHFLDSFSQFIGRDITLKELNQAIQKGEL